MGQQLRAELAGPMGPARDGHVSGSAWRVPALLAALIVYGSLIPFDLDWRGATWSSMRAGVAWPRPNIEDVGVNLLVYVPLGAALFQAFRRYRAARWAGLAATVLLGAGLSLTIEWLQTLSRMRVACGWDVIVNAIGSAVGVIGTLLVQSARPALTARLLRLFAARPATFLSATMTLGLFVYHLMPFDFVTNTDQLRAAFLRARWSVRPAGSLSGAEAWLLLGSQVAAAGWFAVLAYLRSNAALEAGRHPAAAFGSALKHGGVLVVLIEFMELFTCTQSFDLAVIPLRYSAVLLGTWVAVFLADSRNVLPTSVEPVSAAPTALLGALALFQVFVLCCTNLLSPSSTSDRGDALHLEWMPFVSLWRAPAMAAIQTAIGLAISYGAMGCTLLLLLRRADVRAAAACAVIGTTLLAATCELGRGAWVTGAADVTEPFVAALAALAIAALHARLPATARVSSNSTQERYLSPPTTDATQ